MLHFGINMPFYLMALYGSMMIVAVLILRALLKNRLPKFVFPVLWSLVLLRFLVPFSVSTPLSMPVPVNSYGIGAAEAVTLALVEDQEPILSGGNFQQSMVQVSEDAVLSAAETSIAYGNGVRSAFPSLAWTKILLYFVYVTGLLVTAGILGWQKYGYTKKLRNSLLVEHNETVNTLLRDMDMGHVLVFTSDGIASPLVCGLLNPRIYLPTQMDFRNTVLLRHVLAHETAHIRRRDNWMKGILLIVLCLNWYNPLVWIMAVCLVSDLEAACDAAVLKAFGEEERKDYASSLLAMALTGRRTTLLYSAFSRTEVEKRVKNILRYKRMTAFALLFTVLFLGGSTMAFAAVGQAPFQEYLTSFCASSSSKWGVRAALARDIAMGEKAQERAENVIYSVLNTDSTGSPKVIQDRIHAGLAEEFGVEKGAFHVTVQLCLTREELMEEYAPWGITGAKDGFWMYGGEQIRVYEDKMLGAFQSKREGTVDISVQRDEMGEITSVAVLRLGDPGFDTRIGMDDGYRVYSQRAETDAVEYTTAPAAADAADILASDVYEYYLTRDELIADIDRGYLFKLDTVFTSENKRNAAFKQYMAPYVSQGDWPFHVYEENTVDLEIAFSNLLTKPNKNIFPGGERIIVEVFSPDGQSAYRFEKTGDEITEDISIREQIPVTPGEWTLQISFAYVCGSTPAHLRIAAAYGTPSEEDLNWLKVNRLNLN